MLKKFILPAAIAICPFSLQAFENDLELLYPESTLVYSHAKSLATFAQLDKDHPMAKLYKHKAIQSYIKKSVDMDEEGEEFKKETERFFLKHCTERASIGILGAGSKKNIKEAANTHPQAIQLGIGLSVDKFDIGVTLDCSATQKEFADYLELSEKILGGKALNLIKEEFEGETYYEIGQDEQQMKIYVSLTDELLIFATQEESMKDFIGRAKQSKKQKTLAGNAKFLDATEQLRKTDLFAYARLDQAYENLILNRDTSVLNAIRENPQMNMMISADAIANDIHLDAFDSVFFAASLTEDGCDMKYGMAVKSTEGVAGLFTHDRNIPEIPSYVFKDFKAMNVSSYDINSSFQSFEAMLNKISPLGFMAMTQQFGDTYKMFKTNVIENLEPYFVGFSGHIDPALQNKTSSSNIMVFKVKNDDLIHQAMAEIIKKVPTATSLEFLDEKIYHIKNDKKDYFLSVVNGYLVISHTSEEDMWKHVISQIKNPGAGMGADKQLADLWDSMPQGEVSMSYYDLAQLIMDAHFEKNKSELVKVKTKVQINDGNEQAGENDNQVPDVSDLNYSLLTKFYQGDNFWHSELKLRNFSLQNK